jgi:DNA invertase Pin-like site-specific DNA recombinase
MRRKPQLPQIEPTIMLCYVRVSFGREGDDQSPERQRSNMTAYCHTLGFTPEFYEDILGHNSGTSRGKRNIVLLEERIPDGDVVGVMFNDQARVYRNVGEMSRIIDLMLKKEKRLFNAMEKREMSLRDEREVLMIKLRAILDADYAQSISKRARDSAEFRRKQNKPLAQTPFGTVRNSEGYLIPSPYAAWLIPDGSYVFGDINTPPHEDAVCFGFYDCLKRIYETYARNQHGYNRLAEIFTEEGWRFRNRWNGIRPIVGDDIRTVIACWRSYAGIVVKGKSKSLAAYTFENSIEVLHDTGRSVLPLELIQQVATIQAERSFQSRPIGAIKKAYIYPLTGLVYCAKCETIAEKTGDPRLRTRLSGTNQNGRMRYRHTQTINCGCENHSIPLDELEDDFAGIVNLLTAKPDELNLMLEQAIRSQHGTLDMSEQELEKKKKQEMAKQQRKIENLRKAMLAGEIAYEDFAKGKGEAERQLQYWETRTTDAAKKAIEFTMVLKALEKLVNEWATATPEEKQMLAHSLFQDIIYDLDTKRIIAFQLQSWADHYLEVRGNLYEVKASGANNDPSRTQLEHRILSVSTLEFTHTIAFPQNNKLKRLSTELALR